MDTFNDDDEVQKLKDWWKQNWQPVLLGLGLSVGGVLGWNAWQSHTQNVAERASGHYEQLRLSLSKGDLEEAREARQALVDEYPDTPYAAQAALMMASYHVQISDSQTAIAHLEWASENADDDRLRYIATLRLARLLWAQDDNEAALELLQGDDQDAFAPLYAELRGDILLSQKKIDEARTAYEQALALSKESDEGNKQLYSNVTLIQKLNDLGVTTPNSSEGEAS
ncbi:MAG: tetratricopeptide repeat protein [Salinisphaeraceae bacterium]|nr:tetratricopeptide repeat protein [Salinisphaeraceae bacterium]